MQRFNQPISLAPIGLAVVALSLGASGCAPKREVRLAPVPAWDFVQSLELTPPSSLSESRRSEFARGWNELKQGELQSALERIESLSERDSSAELFTARGFLELRVGERDLAQRHFDRALEAQPDFAPALSGLVLAALAENDENAAYERIVALSAVQADHPLVSRYQPVLQVEVAETRLRLARELAASSRFEEASLAYRRALEVAPEVSDLYVEAAETDLRAGRVEDAVAHAERATELAPDDASAHLQLARALDAASELERAYEALSRASRLAPENEAISEELARVAARYERENLPDEYREVERSGRLTRAQLAALLYLELRSAFERAESEQRVIAIDIVDSWARRYIRAVLAAGVLQVFPNHTYQPEAFVTRLELAAAIARALEQLSPDRFQEARAAVETEQSFADLGPSNLSYEAAALSVSLGMMELEADGRFEPQALVSGAEAKRAVEALSRYVTGRGDVR